jgi:conjugative transfer region protein TrbK
MKKPKLDRLPMAAAMLLVVFIVAACAIRLRDDESQTPSAAEAPDPLATKLAECRPVTYEQKNAVSECRKAWAEKRRHFLGQKAATGADQAGSSLFVVPKDESGLPPGIPSIQQPTRE